MPTLISPTDLIIRSWKNFRTNITGYSEFVIWIVLIAITQWGISVVLKTVVPDQYLRISLSIIINLPIALVFTAIWIAMVDYTHSALNKKPLSVRKSFSVSGHRLIPAIWVTILTSLALSFGFLFFIIPGVLFMIWYKFAAYHAILGDERGTKALTASHDLVRARWWAVLWRTLVPALFFILVTSFITTVLQLIMGSILGDPRMFFGTVTNADNLSNLHTLLGTLIPKLVDSFTVALLLGVDITLWMNLRNQISD